MMIGEELKDIKSLAAIKSVEEMIPKPWEVNMIDVNDVATPKEKWRWRPRLTEDQFRIVEECLKLDSTIEEACMLAGISVPAYHKYRESDPDFRLRMSRARQFAKLCARAAVQKRIRQWDAKVALRFLELRDKRRYNEDETDEEETRTNAPLVQFISVPSNEWQKNTTSHDTQTSTKPGSSSQWYSNTWEKLTPRENEDQALKNLNLLGFRSE